MVEISAYSKASDGGKQLSAHFKVQEFACRSGADAVLIAPRLVMVLESIRAYFGSAVTINSGYRTPEYNAKVGGVAHSNTAMARRQILWSRGRRRRRLRRLQGRSCLIGAEWASTRVLPTSTSGRPAPTGRAKLLRGGPEDGNIHAF